jgi:hypothetical protein
MALLATLAAFTHVVAGLSNARLCELMGALLARPYTSRQATYDLRRLRRKEFIERIEGRQLYRITERGRATATFFTNLAARVVVPTLSELEAPLTPHSPVPRALVSAWRNWERELDALIAHAGLAA